MLIYIAGPYRGDVKQNIENARKAAIAVWQAGHVAICPHLNTANFEEDSGLADEVYLKGDLVILQRCDACLFLPNWKQSEGAIAEREFCEAQGIACYTLMGGSIDGDEISGWQLPALMPCPHPVERDCPQQVEGFMSVLMGMYRLHLSKNMDYSPANILGTGEVGTVVRLWDKIARLMNLMGFQLQVQPGTYSSPKDPKHESVNDTLMDAANYAVIALLYRMGKWGR
ncbi:DUF4406 domain-containing protein [Nodosilinea sp. FACHB-131]|uniref:DUF7768 domain-containing protein n=1 Tax=Cyanophyceae TaxID=3028117 RepID=UPI00168459EA|nr:DUF4406 domain-containing protein [Nodosilinea sp. FACHB-131]MBD1871930.1 DUF4406 domain-containing protein [Nodosilinea sp. FACHB-131]